MAAVQSYFSEMFCFFLKMKVYHCQLLWKDSCFHYEQMFLSEYHCKLGGS